MDLFRRIATITARRLGYPYPAALDENVTRYIRGLREVGYAAHSHSIVAGGLVLMSYSTRFTPLTSFTIRLLMRASRS